VEGIIEFKFDQINCLSYPYNWFTQIYQRQHQHQQEICFNCG